MWVWVWVWGVDEGEGEGGRLSERVSASVCESEGVMPAGWLIEWLLLDSVYWTLTEGMID